MTEGTVFRRRNGGTETRGGERFDGPACVAGRLAWPDSNGYTNPIEHNQVRVSVRSGHARRFATPVEPITPHAAHFGLPRSSPFVFGSPFLRVKTGRSANLRDVGPLRRNEKHRSLAADESLSRVVFGCGRDVR